MRTIEGGERKHIRSSGGCLQGAVAFSCYTTQNTQTARYLPCGPLLPSPSAPYVRIHVEHRQLPYFLYAPFSLHLPKSQEVYLCFVHVMDKRVGRTLLSSQNLTVSGKSHSKGEWNHSTGRTVFIYKQMSCCGALIDSAQCGAVIGCQLFMISAGCSIVSCRNGKRKR